MITSSFKETQEGPLTDDVEAGIMAGPVSIESGVVNEDTEERSFLERELLERRWNLSHAAAGVSSPIKNEEKKNNPEADEKKVSQEPPKDYIPVRARRGQAIDDSHSLAERVRREKISERMKILQKLVPDCDKVTGKAHMLDEIINYVRSLQNQVQEQPLTDDVEAGIMDGLASIESGVVNEDTEERSFLERERLERRWNLVQAAAGVSSLIKNEQKKNNPEADEKKVSQEPPKDYIHVRARRGQAIDDSHSLAERVRREKISERMKILQELVPDCDKVTGKAHMLDEIINYVRSLQNQVQLVDRERRKVDLEWIFVTANFVLELPSAVFDQLSSVRKPQFVLLSMLMSFAALFICIIELVYTCRKKEVTWKWRGTLPWLYYPLRSHKPFGSFKDIIGLVCAICQSVVTTINCVFCLQHADSPIKISVWPIIFAFGLLCSKFLGNREHVSTNLLPLNKDDTHDH